MKIIQPFQHQAIQGLRLGYSPLWWVHPVTVCMYRVDGLLVDTGQRTMQREVGEWAAADTIQQIFLTHFHEDHTGNARFLGERSGVPVYASDVTAQRVAHAFPILPYEQFWFGKIQACPGVLPTSGRIATERYTFDVIHTPGHSDDHHILHEPGQGWIFGGDLYIGKLKVFRRNEDIRQHIESARKVLLLDFEVLFCAHNPVFKAGKAALSAKLDYLETIYGKVADLYQTGRSIGEIQAQLNMKEAWLLKWLTFRDVSVRNIIESVVKSEKSKDAPTFVKAKMSQ